MGYRAEVRNFGTYWNTGMIFPSKAAAADPAGFLADLRTYYDQGELIICLDGSTLERQLEPALAAAGWSEGESDIFLAHIGPARIGPAHIGPAHIGPAHIGPARYGPARYGPALEGSGSTAIQMEPVAETNLRDYALTGLIAFKDAEEEPDEETLAAEIARRREELAGSSRGLLARVDGVPAGIMRWFDELPDIWIIGLAVRPTFRRQGIGSALLKRRLVDSYAAGRRSIIINVAVNNDGARRLYGRLGFVDEVYRRTQFISSRPG